MPEVPAMPLDLLPDTFVCAPAGDRLGRQLGPCHGYALPDAPDRLLFLSDEAHRIAGNWRALPAADDGTRYDAHYDAVDEAFRFYDAAAGTWHTWAGEDVGPATLYPIGEGVWAWDYDQSVREKRDHERPARPDGRPHRVFIVDDSAIIRSLLEQYVASEAGLAVCGTAASGAEALERLPGSGCDLALVDVSMPGMSGIELVRRLREEAPAVRCLMLSAHAEGSYVAAALGAGAVGYTTKEEPEVLVEALWAVLRTGTYLSERSRS